jgi:hypothetical protein
MAMTIVQAVLRSAVVIPFAIASSGCAVVGIASTAASLTVGAVSTAVDVGVGAVKVTGKVIGAGVDLVTPSHPAAPAVPKS